MSRVIQPIQTRYRGRHFRSRTEARWAVFFDAAGVEWEYEKEGYDLTELAAQECDRNQDRIGRYLPDFWLPKQQIWVEIKGALPEPHWCVTDDEKKMEYLIELTRAKEGWVFFGVPDICTPCSTVQWDDEEDSAPGLASRNSGSVVDMLYPIFLTDSLFAAAASARFEFGANGAT